MSSFLLQSLETCEARPTLFYFPSSRPQWYFVTLAWNFVIHRSVGSNSEYFVNIFQKIFCVVLVFSPLFWGAKNQTFYFFLNSVFQIIFLNKKVMFKTFGDSPTLWFCAITPNTGPNLSLPSLKKQHKQHLTVLVCTLKQTENSGKK